MSPKTTNGVGTSTLIISELKDLLSLLQFLKSSKMGVLASFFYGHSNLPQGRV